MGDRSFSSNDVLRIFAEHLDEREQEIVREFFMEPADINLAILNRLLALTLNLVSVLTSPLVGLILSALSESIQAAHAEAVDVLFTANRGIAREIGRIDA